MSHRPEPASQGRTPLVLVSGHTFGARAFEGVFSSPAFLDRQIEVTLMIGLDEAHAGATVGYQSLRPLAADHGVRHISTSDGRLTSLAGQIRDAGPAYILVIGWSSLIPAEILSVPASLAGPADDAAGAFGCIGMHPTKLPHGRGQAPIPWTIIKGCERTALSVFFLAAGADSGPVIAQYDLDVHPRESASSLFYRVAHAHYTAGLDLAGQLASRRVGSIVQDEALATRWPKRRPADGEIFDTMTCREIDALVRALLGPYPRAFVQIDGQKLQIGEVRPVTGPAGRPGGVSEVAERGRVRFRCADGVLDLLTEGHRGQP